MTQQELKLGSEELKKKLAGEYFRPIVGQPYTVEVIGDEVNERQFEGTYNGEKRIITKFDIRVKVDEDEFLWGVSKKVLTTINTYIGDTRSFKVILGQNQYDVLPLGL